MSLQRDVEDRFEQRVTGSDQLRERLALNVDEILLEGHPLILREDGDASADKTVPVAYLGGDEGDLEPARLALTHPAAEPCEGLREPRVDVAGLQFAGLGFEHVGSDTLQIGGGDHLRAEGVLARPARRDRHLPLRR